MAMSEDLKASSRRSKPARKDRREKADKKDLDRPFDAKIWKAACATAAEYQVIVSCDDGHWYGRGLELSNVFGDGPTPQKCLDSTREALAVAVAYLLEARKKPPTPARLGKRTQQVNVRLTAEERAMLAATAKKKGYQGISDFLRAVALEAV